MTTPYQQIAISGAFDGTNLARAFGCAIPETLDRAAAAHDTVNKIAGEPFRPKLALDTTDPAKIRASLLKLGTERAAFTATRTAATEAVTQVAGTLIGEYRAALPDFIAHIGGQYSALIAHVRDDLGDAPLDLDAWASDDSAALHLDLRRSANQLDALLNARCQFGLSVGESNSTAANIFTGARLGEPPSDPAVFKRTWPPLNELITHWAGQTPAWVTGVDSPPPLTGPAKWRALIASAMIPELAPHRSLDSRDRMRHRWYGLSGLLGSSGVRAFAAEHANPTDPRQQMADARAAQATREARIAAARAS